jgi:hypothetical protein
MLIAILINSNAVTLSFGLVRMLNTFWSFINFFGFGVTFKRTSTESK